MYRLIYQIAILLFVTLFGFRCGEDEEARTAPPPPKVEELNAQYFVTKGDQSLLLTDQSVKLNPEKVDGFPILTLDASTTYQNIDGFGFAITGGTASHLKAMSNIARTDLLNELFGSSVDEIGMSYIRISMGASDLDVAPFTYNDLTEGTDIPQSNFSIAQDKSMLIPILKEILAINPNVKIMASPWSAPSWMKTNNATKGGSLKTSMFGSYATYFVKYIKAMAAEGIEIESVTIQNEPLHAGNNPSMYMTASDQKDFIKNHLGPLFESESIDTKIIIYDHNADRTDYPLEILADADAKKYVVGSAFHLYGGSINDLSSVHNAHPTKGIYFTEQWYGAPGNFEGDLKWHTENVIIGSLRNWSKAVIEWNLSSNPELSPHTDGGCNQCLGGITIDGNSVARNAGYYVISHASKFVPSGSKRILSSNLNGLPSVSFITPENELVVLALNTSDQAQTFNISYEGKYLSTTLDSGAVGTIVIEN